MRAVNSVQRSLRSILGDNGTEAVINYIEKGRNLAFPSIMEKPEEFTDVLEQIFGASATIIEENILRNLCEDLGLDYEVTRDYGFEKQLKIILEKKSKAGQP